MNEIRCAHCGKFISYDDIDTSKAKVEFIPDTVFGPEEITYVCKDCLNVGVETG